MSDGVMVDITWNRFQALKLKGLRLEQQAGDYEIQCVWIVRSLPP